MCTKLGIGVEEIGVKILVQDVSPIVFSCKVLFIREDPSYNPSKSTTNKRYEKFHSLNKCKVSFTDPQVHNTWQESQDS